MKTYKEILSKITCNGMRELCEEIAEQAAHEYAKQVLWEYKAKLIKSQLNNDFDVIGAYDELVIKLP